MMKPLSEMTHYEILELAPDASFDDVERAYRIAGATFGEDSLATYSLYEEAEATAIRERIDQAYQVLADNEARVSYDRSLDPPERGAPDLDELALPLHFESASPLVAEVQPEIEEFADLAAPGEGSFDGARLRRTRLARGIDLDQIAAVTKVNPTYLAYIEEEQYDKLPANVYVRGFVNAYARCVGLDPERVVPEYMERLKVVRAESGPGRSGRRR